jgi:hypothetical protein
MFGSWHGHALRHISFFLFIFFFIRGRILHSKRLSKLFLGKTTTTTNNRKEPKKERMEEKRVVVVVPDRVVTIVILLK